MRVIAGKFKGLKLNNFEGNEIRPTIDRVKESVFNKIQFVIKNAFFLDLFGGTGGIGIEAISRGAKLVYVCDSRLESCKLIESNYKKISTAPNLLRVSFENAMDFFCKNNIKFDICYLDPPFSTDYGVRAIELLVKNGLIKPDGLIIFEHLKEQIYKPCDEVVLESTKIYGTIAVEFLRLRGFEDVQNG